MDPLNIHHVIRHPLSRIETNNFQDKSGCSINGFRSFLFEEGIVRDLDEMEDVIERNSFHQDYRGYPIELRIKDFDNFPLSDEILRMKNVQFVFPQLEPIHKLVSPEPHFVEEERNLIENHFKYLKTHYEREDVEEWNCFQMDCEGHLISFILDEPNCQLSNESIEHLSNFPHLKNLDIPSSTNIQESVTNLCLLSNLVDLSMSFAEGFQDPELFKDLGLFTNLNSLDLWSHYGF